MCVQINKIHLNVIKPGLHFTLLMQCQRLHADLMLATNQTTVVRKRKFKCETIVIPFFLLHCILNSDLIKL